MNLRGLPHVVLHGIFKGGETNVFLHLFLFANRFEIKSQVEVGVAKVVPLFI
jgi:hypothetical protein